MKKQECLNSNETGKAKRDVSYKQFLPDTYKKFLTVCFCAYTHGILVFFLFSNVFLNLYSRSVHRVIDPETTEIRTRWVDQENTEIYTLKSDALESSTIFDLFDRDHFFKNILPAGHIDPRYPDDIVTTGADLSDLIEECVQEIKQSPKVLKEYKNFIVLKKRNFDARKSVGLLVLKCKKYPFVVKLYGETPYTFARPKKRDLEQRCLFFMAGGISRYLVGFTRIKNLHFAQTSTGPGTPWADTVTWPRKWFWLPKNPRWFNVYSPRISGKKERSIELPALYAVVADTIEAERNLSANVRTDRKFIINLAKSLNQRLDPNVPNYMIERKNGKVISVDTEHFPTNVGMRRKLFYENHSSWYFELAKKYMSTVYLRAKKTRLAVRSGTYQPIILPIEHPKDEVLD